MFCTTVLLDCLALVEYSCFLISFLKYYMFPVYVSSMFVIGFLRRGLQNECACTALMVNSSHFKMSSINSSYFFSTHIINLCVTSPHLWQTVLTRVATLKAKGIHLPEFIKVKITATRFLGAFQIKSFGETSQ